MSNLSAISWIALTLTVLGGGQAIADNETQLEPNVLHWSTASEKDNFGFDVYRALAKSGPYEKINEDAIPAAGTTDMPQRYEYIDRQIEPDTVYWYYVESISFTGERRRATPKYAAKPKTSGQQAD